MVAAGIHPLFPLLLALEATVVLVVVEEPEASAVEAAAVLDLDNGGMVFIKSDLPIHAFNGSCLVNKMMVYLKEQVSTLTSMVTFPLMFLVEMLLNLF